MPDFVGKWNLIASKFLYFNKTGPTQWWLWGINAGVMKTRMDFIHLMQKWDPPNTQHGKNHKILEIFAKLWKLHKKEINEKIVKAVMNIKFSQIKDQSQHFSSICLEMTTIWNNVSKKSLGKIFFNVKHAIFVDYA